MFLLNVASALIVLLAAFAPVDGVAVQGKKRRPRPSRQQTEQKKTPPVAGVTYLEGEERAEIERAFEELYTQTLNEYGVPLKSPDLIKALGHRYSIVKIAAAHFLGKRGERGAVPALRKLLNDPDSDVKVKAARVLLQLGDPSGFKTLADEAKNKGASVRLAAVAASIPFAGLASHKPQVVALLTAALRDENKDVRAAAAVGLGDVGDPSAAPELRRALGVETDQTVRLVIEQQLRKLGL